MSRQQSRSSSATLEPHPKITTTVSAHFSHDNIFFWGSREVWLHAAWFCADATVTLQKNNNYNVSFINVVWFDSFAIYLAVIIVAGVSSFVDWRKEKEFVKRSQDDEDNKLVSKGENLVASPFTDR